MRTHSESKTLDTTPDLGVANVTPMLTAALSLAALSNKPEQPLGIAACSFDIQIDQPWQQILPGSDFAAYDGRPFEVPGNKWKIDNVSGAALAAELNSRAEVGQTLLFDYDHQTLLSKENGQKAPASGRGHKFEWRNDEGLFVQLKFTPAARQHIKDEEYAFYSPVVMYDKGTGQVKDIHSVALTNDPAIKGMAQAAALTSQITNQPSEPQPMNPALALLFSLIGIDVEKDKDIDAAALHSLLTTKDANTAITVLKAKLDKLGESDTQIAALKAKLTTAEKGVNLSTHVPIETYNAVIEEMASLKADHGTVTVAQVIEQAQTDGKFIAAAEVDYLTKLGNTDIAALKANIDLRPTVGAFQGKQTKDQKNPGKSNENDMAALSGADDAVRKQMGLSVEQFKAARTV